jgi:hypothetical protein
MEAGVLSLNLLVCVLIPFFACIWNKNQAIWSIFDMRYCFVLAGLKRCGKSCRLRWINYLRPELKRGSFSAEEEQIIIDVHRILGNRWGSFESQ